MADKVAVVHSWQHRLWQKKLALEVVATWNANEQPQVVRPSGDNLDAAKRQYKYVTNAFNLTMK